MKRILNLKHLRYFYEIANEGQITKAAKKLHIAQPPLSQALKNLETNLDVTLFERIGRQMELTEAGKVLYEKAKMIFQNVDDTILEVQEVGKGIRGTLSVGCNKSCFSHIPQKITAYREKYPQVKFQLIEGDSYFLSRQLIEREIEIAFVRLPIDLQHFQFFELPEEKYVAVVHHDWLKSKKSASISIHELAEIPLLLLHRLRGVGQFELIIDKFIENGLNPNILCESPNVDMLLALVNEGLGATIVPQSTLIEPNHHHISVLEISDTNIISKSAIIWLKERYLSKSAERFIDLFKQEI